MRRNTTKMHPGAVLGPPAGRANFWKKNRPPEHGEISSEKGHPDRFRAIPDQVPEKCFFQGYRLCRPDAQNAGKHVYSIRRIAQNTEKHVYSIRRIAQNAGKHMYSIRRIAQNAEKHVYSIRRIAQNAEKHVYSIKRIATLHIKMHIFYMPDCHIAHKNACILHAGLPRCTQKCTYSICRIPTLRIKMHVFYMPDRNIAHKNACILYAGLPCCT